MIGYIEGPIHLLESDRVVVLAGGVGYSIQIPLSTYYKLERSKVAQLQIHTHVREDALALYGFSTAEEKFAFEKLISISGIGPRLAQVILSGIEVGELSQAIARGDARRLSAIPGVGKKTSERIILELRDKLILTSTDQPRQPLPPISSVDEDVVSALMNLGYKAAAAESAVRAAHQQNEGELEFSLLIKAALRQLTR
jgi:Holliday junction DNA helicase RuvA